MTRESEAGGLTLAYTYDSSGNRTSMTASGTESYTVNYSYDVNNRLTSSVYADGTHASTYSYDAAGNLLTAQEWKPQEGIASTASYSYNYLNQLASQTVNGRSSSFAYNADGIRTAKAVGRRLVGYLLDGGNIIGETEGGELVATYQRGVNLISCIDPRDTNFEETYYLYNAHGDVTGLTDEYGNLTKTYEYDSFGNEKNKTSDPNPFRYCGEYYDAESGSYYLRARYYNPAVGRFTQEDTHWNTGNMIYGDAKAQTPSIAAIRQSGNLYVYCGGNPIIYVDSGGFFWETAFDIAGIFWSGVDMWNDPSWSNLGFLLWDIGATVVPFLPGSYTAKGGKLLLKTAGKADDAVDAFKALKRADLLASVGNGNLIAPFKQLKKIAKDLGQEVHHLIEKRFAKNLKINADEILSIAIDHETHTKITKLMRKEIPYNSKWREANELLMTATAKPQEIWDATRRVYTQLGLTEYLEPLKEMLINAGHDLIWGSW